MMVGMSQQSDPYKPIINSLTDVDFYKFTMGQVIFHNYCDVPVKFAFKNRTKRVRLGEFVDEEDLRSELDHVRSLRFNKTELHYLRGTNEYEERMFDEDYLEFLGNLELLPYNLEMVDGNINLDFSGKWSEVTYWETIALSIINELYYQSVMEPLSEFERDTVYATGVQKLAEKIDILKSRPDITFCDFGTRRRFSRDWHDYVVGTLADELPEQQFLGTSNTHLAMKYGLLPMGTCAHEMDMGVSGIMHGSDEEIRSSHKQVRQDWWDEYGWGLSIDLPDTYGTDFGLRDMTPKEAREWKGFRQDSGDPFEITDKTLAFYDSLGIDPTNKLIIYSDGLDIGKIVKLADYTDRIRKSFGWGTNLTNDLGLPTLSIVVKLMESNGHGTVKLSDNLAKALGKPEDIERFKRIFGYKGTMYEECKY